MKLKTLKDCERAFITDGALEQEPYVRLESLKQEAIKHIKFYRNLGLPHEAVSLGKFFDITEEDLK